jgi:hypothetical protein
MKKTLEMWLEEMESCRDADAWSDFSEFPRSDWQAEVANADTQLGYWEWVEHQIESNFDPA